MDFFATAAKGTEPALRDELREIGVRGVRADRGGVHFGGALDLGARVCLESRIAVRVLAELGRFDAGSVDALYAGVREIDWAGLIGPRHTLAVRASVRDGALTHSGYVALKTKDAIVDVLRDKRGWRPSVDTEDPDVLLFVHVAKDSATVYLDIGGGSLHQRGWRARSAEAPMKETLAAAILRLAGWDRRSPLRDPMCGSGTLAIEAALWARGVAPGLSRPRLGVERAAWLDDSLARRLAELRSSLRERARTSKAAPDVAGSDLDPTAVAIARANAAAAGVGVDFEVAPVSALRPTSPPGWVVTNPPYGERLATDGTLYREMAKTFSQLAGHHVTVLAGSMAILRAFPSPPDRSLLVLNGPIECRLLSWEIGSRAGARTSRSSPSASRQSGGARRARAR
ncbi:MAG: RNA methyltransferase [Deltaproteobacteria bacterium]|nr:RNA methyltransferase [Deltaproteobacteria bacterium]